MADQPSNQQIADVLDRIAALLEVQDANTFRVRAYRSAAERVRESEQSVAELAATEGRSGLAELPDIGPSLAGLIAEYVETGRAGLLDRLEGEATPERVFARVPGIGEALAQRIHDELGIATLEELELAAHDGRLAKVAGFGERRVEAVRGALAGMLSPSAQRRGRERAAGAAAEPARPDRPSVALILEIDAEYRRRAEAGQLKQIAPRRFNPQGEAWLPILHAEREGWSFTALYSNTRQAHDLGKVRDWVVIYFERGAEERQNTVVTETRGPLEGKRVVRGREDETRAHYEQR